MPTSPYSHLPLRWESTGEQWWYATPIDLAAATGLSDLVNELLHIDPNLVIKLTSLRRIRRLESVWDNPDPTNGVAQCRARVARALLSACEPEGGRGRDWENSLIRAGYGGWLLYTAASAGDVAFVRELVEIENVSVFGEGEYGITDILYAAARSKNSEVFRFLFEFAMDVLRKSNEGGDNGSLDSGLGISWEMMNRALHAASRGGNLEILKEFLRDCSDVLAYRDAEGSTILHSAASRGQVEVVRELISTCDHIINSTDNQGNTALHVAAYRGCSSVVEALSYASPSLTVARNKSGDTFLHLAVAGFRSPGFHQIDQQINLMNELLSGKIISLKDIINIRNNEGRTVLHTAVSGGIQLQVVELLIRLPSINLNIRDNDGFTPLDLLNRSPETASSRILIKQVSSAGGIASSRDQNDGIALVRHRSGAHAIVTSPGTSFRLLDAEFFIGNDNDSELSCEPPSSRLSSGSSEPTSDLDSPRALGPYLSDSKRISGSGRFKLLSHWLGKGDRKLETTQSFREEGRNLLEGTPTPLRQKFSRNSFRLKSDSPSPLAKERFAESLMQGVIQATPPKSCFSSSRFSSALSKSLAYSPSSGEKLRGVNNGLRSPFFRGPLNAGKMEGGDGNKHSHRRGSSFNRSLMNQYFCFGAQGLAVEDSVSTRLESRSCRRLVF